MNKQEEKVSFIWTLLLGVGSWIIIAVVGTMMIRLMR